MFGATHKLFRRKTVVDEHQRLASADEGRVPFTATAQRGELH